MQDNEIVDLYFARDERAIRESADKYGLLCRGIALRILSDEQDAEECVNDTWVRAWNAIPPTRPPCLRTWLCKVARNLSLDRLKHERAARRDRSMQVSLEQFGNCISLPDSEADRLPELFNRFLGTLGDRERNLFVGRYWQTYTLEQLAAGHGMTVSGVRYSLDRTREALKAFLEKEGCSV